MSTVDFVVFIVMALSIALAVLRGFVREVLTIIAWVGAVFAVLYGMPLLRPVVRGMFKDETTADIASGAFLGIMTLVLLSVAAHYLGKLIKKSGLTPVDRVLGALFGAARAALLLCLGYILVDSMWKDNLPDWMSQARSQPYLAQGADRLMAVLPENVTDMLTPKKDKSDGDDTEVPPEKPEDEKATTSPDAGKDAKPSEGTGYREKQRDDMDKLIEKNETNRTAPQQ